MFTTCFSQKHNGKFTHESLTQAKHEPVLRIQQKTNEIISSNNNNYKTD